MLELDGTDNKSVLGANAILGVSLANLKAAAKYKDLELYEYLGKEYSMPKCMMNILNGGAHASNKLDFQEFMIVPNKEEYKENLRMGSEIFNTLKNILKEKDLLCGVGDEGGFAPLIEDAEEALDLIEEAITKSGYTLGKDINIALDVAASEFYDEEKDTYLLEGKEYTREETAYDLIKQIYPNEISKNYNNKYLSDDTKNYISNLTNEIIKEYEDMINTSWMDNETKSKAVTKLNNIKINIGTSYIKDLSSYYDFNSNISLVKNIINLNKVVRAASYEMLDTTTTTNALPDYTFNAYYDVTSNSINILTGSTKVIKDINNKYENLGSIGFIIAHEISHAFDNNGSKFDENGFLSNWYTTSSQEKYQEIQNKVIDYYNNYEIIHNVSNNGTRTIGENIADLGAMECITNILIRNNANKKDYQTTYESFAKVWANNYSKSTKVLQSLIDTHSPNEIRVNGVLSSTERFYETYKIDSKDLMYIEPEKRVNIWS